MSVGRDENVTFKSWLNFKQNWFSEKESINVGPLYLKDSDFLEDRVVNFKPKLSFQNELVESHSVNSFRRKRKEKTPPFVKFVKFLFFDF